MPLLKITSDQIEIFRGQLIKDLGAPKSVNFCVHTLRLMLNRAVKWRMLRENPYSLDSLKVNHENGYAWWDKKENIQKFLRTAEQKYPRYYVCFLIALETGLRLAEVVGLSKNDIDFNIGKIRIHRQWIEKEKVYGPTKSGKERWVQFDPYSKLARELKAALLRSPDREVIFVNKEGKRVNGRHLSGKVLRKIIDAAGVPVITFHDLRHTFASWYMKDIGDIWALKKILGHSSITTTQRYAHHSPHHREPVLNLMEGITSNSRQESRDSVVTAR